MTDTAMTDTKDTDTSTPRTGTGQLRPAPLWRRLAALLYDLIAVLAIVMVVGMISQIATGGHLIATGTHTRIAWWYQPLQLLVVLAYFVVSWLRGGQTLGMRPWRLYLRMGDGSALRPRVAVLRAVVAAAPLLLLAVGRIASPGTAVSAIVIAWAVFFAFALFDRRSRALHDLIAGTELVEFMPKKARNR